MSNAPQEQQVTARPHRRRRLLTGCLVVVIVLAVAGFITWWVVSRNLGGMLAGLVREQATAAINGTFEFESLEVDLAGRAVLTNARVIPENGTEPVLECPKAVVGFDLFNFIGPNRGRRAVAITLYDPVATLTREPDGGFNLAHLAKESESESEPLGITVHLRNATVHFMDWCLLDQGYPRLSVPDGIAGDLLDELGYDVLGSGELRPHSETLGVGGNVVLNPERGELAFKLAVDREEPGGTIQARGTATLDGTGVKIHVSGKNIEFTSVAEYVNALFPSLAIGESSGREDQADPAVMPYFAGEVREFSLVLSNRKSSELEVEGEVELTDTRFVSRALPELRFNRLKAGYKPGQERLTGDIEFALPGLTLSGRPALNLADNSLSGKLDIELTDIDKLAAHFGANAPGVTGTATAAVSLGGTTDAPRLSARLASDKLGYRQLNLGRLGGDITFDGGTLTLDGVEFRNGDLTLQAAGSLDPVAQSGSLDLTTGEMDCQAALKLAAKFLSEGQVPDLDLAGKFQATASLAFAAGKPAGSLQLTSNRLTVSGQRLDTVKVKAAYTAPNLKLESVEATYVGQAVNLAGFTSDGPLKVKLRAGGSISTLPDQQEAVLAIIGEGDTLNLAPSQAKLSFKVIGPAGDPELRLQVKTTQDATPLVLSANGHYRTGFAPVTASLSWLETTVDFNGEVDFTGQRVRGDLSAVDVNLRRFSGNEQLSGTLSATARVGGTFTAPEVTGTVEVPQAGYVMPRRTLAVTDAKVGFELIEGNRVKVSDGGFGFSGNRFKINGELGAEDSSLILSCADFNLFSVVALAQPEAQPGTKGAYLSPPLEVQSSGPLKVTLTGELADPRGTVTYSSAAGVVHGHAFNSAELAADFNLDGVEVRKFTVTSDGGSISADGLVNFNPQRYNAAAEVNDFDIGILTSLGGESMAGLTGNLNGRLTVNGDQNGYTANGTLRLADGSFEGVSISTATAEIHTSGKKIGIRNGNIVAEGTILTAQGSFDPTAANPLGTLSLSLDATSVDLALLEPFLAGYVKDIDGRMACQLDLTPTKGEYPNATFTADSAGGKIRIDAAEFESMSIRASMADQVLTIERYEFSTANSTLDVTGRLDLGRIQAGKTVPLDLAVNSRDFRLKDLRPLLPVAYQALLPGGTVTCRDLRLTGNSDHPLLSGTLDVDLVDMPPEFDVVARVTGSVKFTDNGFDITSVRVVPAGTTDNFLTVRGSGLMSLAPPSLVDGEVSIQLDNSGEYIYVDTHNASSELLSNLDFTGWIGGTIHIGGKGVGRGSDRMKIWGNVVVNQSGKTSKVTVYQREAVDEDSEPAMFMFDPVLTVTVEPGTKMHYQPMDIQGAFVGDIRADLAGSVKLAGVPGLNRAGDPDSLRISGDILLPDGSVKVYRHTVRLAGEGNKLMFQGIPGQLLPVFNGRGSLTLRNVLTASQGGTNVTEITGMNLGGSSPSASNRDLKVFFTFNKFRLDADYDQSGSSTGTFNDISGNGNGGQGLRITSEPALPEEQIIAYLLGGARDVLSGQTGLGDFAQGELVAYGTSFISREIEELFDLSAFQFGGIGDDDNPFYVDMEKSLTPDFTVTYYRDYFSDSMQNEEFGVKYRLLEQHTGSRYQNVELELNFQDNAFTGSGSEFMFTWTTSF